MQKTRTNQWMLRYDIRNDQVWGTKRKRIEEKWTESKGPVGYHQMHQYTHQGSPRREIEKEQREYLRVAENVPYLMKDINIQATQLTERWTWRDLDWAHYN